MTRTALRIAILALGLVAFGTGNACQPVRDRETSTIAR
jgi:hypothetical protein